MSGRRVVLWGVAGLLVLEAGCVAAQRSTRPSPTPRYVVPSTVPGWWAFCVEDPAMNWTRPGEPKVAGWTTCLGTVDELRDRANGRRLVGSR